MAINEIQRQAYLKAMGVTSYFPRFILPGAAPSSLCDWPADTSRAGSARHGGQSPPYEAPVEKEAPPQAAGKRPDIDLEPPQQAISSGRAGSARHGGQSPPYEAPSQMAGRSANQLQFKVALIPLEGGLAVLDQLPVMGNGQLPPSHFRLLRNLLRACGLPGPSEQTLIMPFQWPLLELSHIDNGAEAASSALQAFIEHHCQEQGLRCLLLMGPSLVEQLYGDVEEPGQGLQQFAGQSWQTLVTESLDQVLKVGTLKRGLWQSLKHLKKPDAH